MKVHAMHAGLVVMLGMCGTASSQTGTAYVDLGSSVQTIRGFGGSSAWQGQYTDTEADLLFSNGDNQQMGLSLLRVRIDPAGYNTQSSWAQELSNAQKAAARGASVIASPWTPPASMKSNNNVVGGSLNTSSYSAYANYLQTYVTYMKGSGVSLYAISMQNEPDATVTYESCGWTAAQMQTWVANNASVIATKLMMPESEGYQVSYSDPTLNNATSASHVAIVAGHLYGTSPFYYTNAKNKGKEVWMTEHYISGLTIATAISMAKEIHDSMTVADYNAYVWWYMKDNSIGLINTSDQLTILGYTMGQFAKFIRPGYVRSNATYNPSTNVYTSAYKGSGHYVVVAINTGSSAVNQPFVLQNATVSSLVPYRTSSSKSMAQLSTVYPSSGSFTYSLPAQSVTTFVY